MKQKQPIRVEVKPSGRTFHGTSQQGDGPMCPVEGHGRTYMIAGRAWCPHQSHDNERVKKDG